MIVHEAELSFGVGAEIAARIAEKAIFELSAPIMRVGSHSLPVPVPGIRALLHTERGKGIESDRQGSAGMIQ